jgi:hypothetical protein
MNLYTTRGSAKLVVALSMACAAVSTWAAEPPPSEAQKIRIENFSGLRGIQEYIYKNAPAELRNTLILGQHAVFVSVTTFEGSKTPPTCLAMVGLTHPEADGRNPRIPAVRYIGILESSKKRFTPSERDGCKLSAVRSALQAMWKDPIETVLQNFEKTAPEELANADPTSQEPLRFWSDTSKTQALIRSGAAVVPEYVAQTFDYRKLQLAIFSGVIDLKDRLVCYAIVGLTGRSPNDSQPRYPENTYSRLEVLAKSKIDLQRTQSECAGIMVRSALKHMIADYTAIQVTSAAPSPRIVVKGPGAA